MQNVQKVKNYITKGQGNWSHISSSWELFHPFSGAKGAEWSASASAEMSNTHYTGLSVCSQLNLLVGLSGIMTRIQQNNRETLI